MSMIDHVIFDTGPLRMLHDGPWQTKCTPNPMDNVYRVTHHGVMYLDTARDPEKIAWVGIPAPITDTIYVLKKTIEVRLNVIDGIVVSHVIDAAHEDEDAAERELASLAALWRAQFPDGYADRMRGTGLRGI